MSLPMKEIQEVGKWFAAKEKVATIKVPAVPFHIFAVPTIYNTIGTGSLDMLNNNHVYPADILDTCIHVECEKITDIYDGFPDAYAVFITDNAEGNAPTTHDGDDVQVWWSLR